MTETTETTAPSEPTPAMPIELTPPMPIELMPIELTEVALEALLFVAERPLARREIATLAGQIDISEVTQSVAQQTHVLVGQNDFCQMIHAVLYGLRFILALGLSEAF